MKDIKLLILMGLPGSGKTTFAKKYKKEEKGTFVIHMDDVKQSLWYVKENTVKRCVAEGLRKFRDEKCIAVAREDVYNAAKEYGTGLYADATCSTKATDTGYETGKYYAVARTGYSKLNTTEIPDSVRESGAGYGAYIEDLGLQIGKPAFAENQYYVRFNLGITAQPETTPTAGNKIGTITVSFRAK